MPKYVRGVFIMWKKILISIGLIIILIAGIEIFNILKKNKTDYKNRKQNKYLVEELRH